MPNNEEALRERVLSVDKLAAIIRNADSNHTMGAGALAEAIADSGYLNGIWDAARRLPVSGDNADFGFTDAEWREYQAMPDQGYSHRGKLEFFVNRWLASQRREVEVTDDMVERLSIFLCDEVSKGNRVTPFEQNYWLDKARAALVTALGGGE